MLRESSFAEKGDCWHRKGTASQGKLPLFSHIYFFYFSHMVPLPSNNTSACNLPIHIIQSQGTMLNSALMPQESRALTRRYYHGIKHIAIQNF